MNFEKLKEILEQNKSFVITSHVNPDADAIGSELALYYVLKKLNKDVEIINHSATPYNLMFLDRENVIKKYDSEKHQKFLRENDVLIALDLNQSNRLISMEDEFCKSNAVKICIDHHKDPGEFADHYFLDADYAATGEIIYDFMENTKIVELDYEIALQVYAAIVTDTGSFKYDRTTPKLHHLVAQLLEKGVNPTYVSDQIYDQSNISKLKLLGEALRSLKVTGDSKIAYMSVTRESLEKTGANEVEVDGFVNYCLSIKDVKIGLLFFELKDGFKISFRSKGSIPINKLAAEFGGGGHINAAGTRLYNEKLDEYIDKVIKAAEKYLNE